MTRLRSDITTTRNQEEKGLGLCRLGLPTIAVLWAGRLVNGWWVTGRPGDRGCSQLPDEASCKGQQPGRGSLSGWPCVRWREAKESYEAKVGWL